MLMCAVAKCAEQKKVEKYVSITIFNHFHMLLLLFQLQNKKKQQQQCAR